jgi:hypothetical protein
MQNDLAYDFMRDTLKAVLPSLEMCARMAKSTPAKRNLSLQIAKVKDALRLAEQAELHSVQASRTIRPG